jgi:cytochrome c-type biogenesis protein CcmE
MRKRYFIGGGILLAAVIYLLFLSLGNAVGYYVTVCEFYDRETEFYNTNLRVAGKVIAPVEWDAEKVELRFTIIEGNESMPVVFHGAQPSGFKADSSILVEGKYGSDGVFQAKQLILKCPSKYEETVE